MCKNMAEKPNIHLKYKNKIKVISSDWPYLTFSELKSETHIYFFALVNVSDQVIATKSIKYKNYIHSDGNLFFLSVPIPEFQSSAVDFSITNCTSYWSPNHCSIIHFCTYMFLAAVGTPYSLFMSPPVRVGRHCFCLGWLSVCLSVCPSQNRVCSVTWKLFKVSSWNFIQILKGKEHKIQMNFV